MFGFSQDYYFNLCNFWIEINNLSAAKNPQNIVNCHSLNKIELENWKIDHLVKEKIWKGMEGQLICIRVRTEPNNYWYQ